MVVNDGVPPRWVLLLDLPEVPEFHHCSIVGRFLPLQPQWFYLMRNIWLTCQLQLATSLLRPRAFVPLGLRIFYLRRTNLWDC